MFSRQRWKRLVVVALIGAVALGSAAAPGLPPLELQSFAAPLEAVTGYPIYDDSLASGWSDWSWGSSVNLADTSRPYSGSRAIAWKATSGWGGLYLRYGNGLDTSGYTTLSLALQASQTGQKVAVMLYDDQSRELRTVDVRAYGGDPPAGSYRRYDLPLTALDGANRRIKGVAIKEGTGTAKPIMYVDQVQLTGGASPTVTPTKTTTATTTPIATPTRTATATTTPITTPTTTAVPTATSTAPPSSGNCLGVPAYTELRPENATANGTRVARPQVSVAAGGASFQSYFDKITGDCQGTTEQILEWAAVKWNLPDRDLVKAVAAQESWWKQSIKGDYGTCSSSWCLPGYPQPSYHSYSILQIMRTAWPGSWVPASASVGQSLASTAFAADYYGAVMRMKLDGRHEYLGASAQSLWDAVGSWYCGCGWSNGSSYTNQVKQYLQDKPWRNSVGKAPWWF